MANEYSVNAADLTAVADAIRAKGETAESLSFPDGYVLAIEAISGESYELPVLNADYPQDVSVIESANGSATFYAMIDTPGKPAEYTYQWFENGSAISGATSEAYTKTGLTSAGVYEIYCKVTNAAGTVTSRIATLTVQSSQPTYTYSGSHELIKENTYGWKLKLKTSGTLNFSHLGSGSSVDVFLVGGGGGGNEIDNATYGAGGGGGYTLTAQKEIAINTDYTITVGGGGSKNTQGGSSSALGFTIGGGYGATEPSNNAVNAGKGGSGGAGGSANAGDNGGSGSNHSGGGGTTYGGSGQGTTTKEFGESSGIIYSGGGAHRGTAGTGGGTNGVAGTTNRGGGGGRNAKGGSGIVIIRNHR